jgi:hypothetical protein
MAYRYSHTLYMTVGPNEIAVDVVYTVTPGFAGDRIDPPYGPEVDILTVEAVIESFPRFGVKTVKREPVTGWLLDVITNCPDINADLLSEAGEAEMAEADDHAERLWDERRMGL